MTKATIMVDCDLVLTDPIPDWIEWMNNATGLSIDPFKIEGYKDVDYNIVKYWGEAFRENSVDPFDFWRNKHLYDDAKPMPWSKPVLEGLHDKGHMIGVVTHCKGYSAYSKHRFVMKHYPYVAFFINTQEKWAARGDIMIDDRLSHLASMPWDVGLVQYMSPYRQDVEIENRPLLQYTWTMGTGKLLDFIEGYVE